LYAITKARKHENAKEEEDDWRRRDCRASPSVFLISRFRAFVILFRRVILHPQDSGCRLRRAGLKHNLRLRLTVDALHRLALARESPDHLLVNENPVFP
jgi:hypothetical protein